MDYGSTWYQRLWRIVIEYPGEAFSFLGFTIGGLLITSVALWGMLVHFPIWVTLLIIGFALVLTAGLVLEA